MSSTKCSQCGLTNFRSAEHCKRCKASLSSPSAPEESHSSPADAPALSADNFERLNASYETTPDDTPPRRSISPLRILLTVLLIVGPVWYHFDKQETERAARAKAIQEQQQKYMYERERARDLERIDPQHRWH